MVIVAVIVVVLLLLLLHEGQYIVKIKKMIEMFNTIIGYIFYTN